MNEKLEVFSELHNFARSRCFLDLFTDRAVFKQKRAEQTFAAESILKLADYSKQYKMVEIVLEKLFKVRSIPIHKS